jgi:hypothetical protein
MMRLFAMLFALSTFCLPRVFPVTKQSRVCIWTIVSRWGGILWCATSSKITIKKVIALVNCLAKLHNFCIDESESDVPEESPTDMMNMMMSNREGI